MRPVPMWLTAAVCLALLAWSGTGTSLRPLPLVSGRPLRIAFLGDSLTAGYGLRRDLAYPALVEAGLKARGFEVEVVNLGVPGDTTADGLSRLDAVIDAAPDLVFLALGANDGLRRVPVSQVHANLTATVERLQGAGAGVVMAGVYLPMGVALGYRGRFHAVFPGVAGELGLALLPDLLAGVTMKAELNQADRIHPNAAGQQVVAASVLAFLEPQLDSMSPG